MIGAPEPVLVGPSAYVAWRETSLGAVTERLELRTMLDLMGELQGARVLDVGCGDGRLACLAAARGALVTGVDANPAMLAAARARAEEEVAAVEFFEGRVERLPLEDVAFDFVTAVTVLCFVDDADRAFAEMARVLRPGGCLIVGELESASLWALARRLRGRLGSSTWGRAHFRSAAELRSLAGRAGLRVEATRGVAFYPPLGLLARLMAPLDPWLGRRTTFGAAFVALRAIKAEPSGGNA